MEKDQRVFTMRLNLAKPSEKRIWLALQEHLHYSTSTKYVKEALLEFIENEETREILSDYKPKI